MNDYRYLDLLEKALSFSLWPEPLKPMGNAAKTGVVASLAKALDAGLNRIGLRLAYQPSVKDHDRENGTCWPAMAHTMVGRKRLRNIRQLCNQVFYEHIPGAWVECGVWRGGASIYARACLPYSIPVICCDSFDGFPDTETEHSSKMRFIAVTEQEVENNFRKYGLWFNVQLVKGFFKDTLHGIPGPIAILRADGDLYTSTLEILTLYPKVSPGGFVIIDDYGALPKCRQAVDEFRKRMKITAPLVPIDWTGVYWRKT